MAAISNRLTPQNHQKTSEECDDYNCVAWALSIDDDWYDHSGLPATTRPQGLDQSGTVAGYVAFFESRGFSVTNASAFVSTEDRIAVYGDAYGSFAHVARQVDGTNWASKLGGWEDIYHTSLDCLEGGDYGHVRVLMSRPHSCGWG